MCKALAGSTCVHQQWQDRCAAAVCSMGVKQHYQLDPCLAPHTSLPDFHQLHPTYPPPAPPLPTWPQQDLRVREPLSCTPPPPLPSPPLAQLLSIPPHTTTTNLPSVSQPVLCAIRACGAHLAWYMVLDACAWVCRPACWGGRNRSSRTSTIRSSSREAVAAALTCTIHSTRSTVAAAALQSLTGGCGLPATATPTLAVGSSVPCAAPRALSSSWYRTSCRTLAGGTLLPPPLLPPRPSGSRTSSSRL